MVKRSKYLKDQTNGKYLKKNKEKETEHAEVT